MGERVNKIEEQALKNSISYMSDSKWRKLFFAIDEIEDILTGSKWNLLWSEVIIVENLVPNSQDIADKSLIDGSFYYVNYADIVWLELITNKPEKVMLYLSTVANFKLHKTDDGVRIIGYE